MIAARSTEQRLLLGEWGCLGLLSTAPMHGFAVAARLKPEGDVGRVWSLSRALTYRALDQLVARGLIEPVAQEPGIAGGNRTILAITRPGRAQLRTWLQTPVTHLRDLRSELLLKLLLADLCGIDIASMLERQRAQVEWLAEVIDGHIAASEAADVVALWRSESSHAALRFLGRLPGR